MLTPTHMVAGQFAYLAACLATGHPPAMPEAWTAAGCALLPDLDKRNGIVGRLFPYLSEPLEFRFGHRTLTHSLFFLLALSLVLWPLLPFGWWLALVTGYGSHSMADMMTPQGVAWFWPARWRCVLPGNERYRMQAMGWGELTLAALLGVSAAPMLSLAESGEGAGGIIKAAIGSIEEARERYDAEKGANAWTLRVEGRDNLSYQNISGEYPIIGPWREGGFIIESDGGPRSVCRASSCDWYSESGVAVKGPEEAVTVRTVSGKVVGRAQLIEALGPLQEAGSVYLLGTASARGIEEAPPSVTVTGESVTLHYATPGMLADWRPVRLRQVDLVVQVRHSPGETIPEIVGIDENNDRSPLIKRWIE